MCGQKLHLISPKTLYTFFFLKKHTHKVQLQKIKTMNECETGEINKNNFKYSE